MSDLVRTVELLREAAEALADQAEIAVVSYERARLAGLAERCRELADALAEAVLAE